MRCLLHAPRLDILILGSTHHSRGLGLIVLSFIAYYVFLYPRYVSPLRVLPGPPWGHILFGQFPAIIRAEAGILQREWVKQYGPVVRAIGPFGLERIIFTKVDALHKILVSDWMAYPRVSLPSTITHPV